MVTQQEADADSADSEIVCQCQSRQHAAKAVNTAGGGGGMWGGAGEVGSGCKLTGQSSPAEDG